MALKVRRRSPEPENATRIGSVRNFLSSLDQFERDTDHVYFYRGHSDFTFDLLPSIYRNRGWTQSEDVLFKELILRCPNDFGSERSTFQTLVRMQHYALPTRLLDITSNPLIALYFASEIDKPLNESGEVLVFRVPKREIKYFDSDTVSVLSNISKRPANFDAGSPTDDLDTLNRREDIKLLLHEIRSEKPYFEAKIQPAHLHSVLCVKPKMDNARIIRQDGAFFLFGVAGSKLKPASLPSHYAVADRLPRLIIKWDEKRTIRDQLESFGITKGTIFPEIERVAEYIRSIHAIAEPETLYLRAK